MRRAWISGIKKAPLFGRFRIFCLFFPLFGRKNYTGASSDFFFAAPVLKFCPFVPIFLYVALLRPLFSAFGRSGRLAFLVPLLAAFALCTTEYLFRGNS
jgi:hypothetical protein